MNEKTITELLDSLTIEQTDQLVKHIDINASPFTKRRILKQTKAKIDGRRKKGFGFLVPVTACVCGVVVMLAAFPETADAIKEFFQKTFSVSSYMGTPQEERAAIADVEEVIQYPEQSGDYLVTLGPEIADWESIAAARQKYGFPAFAQQDFAWLKEIQPEVKEVLYDGNNVIVTGFLQTDHALAFYPSYMNAPDATQHVAFSGATLAYGSASIAGGADPQFYADTYSEDETGRTADPEAVHAQGGIPFQAYFVLEDGQALPDGTIDASLTLDINDGAVDDMGGVGKIAQVQLNLSFDATSGNATKETAEYAQTQAITGDAVITVHYDDGAGYHTYGNINMPLDGMEITAEKVETSQTGLAVYITETLPTAWSDEIKSGYMDGYSAKNGGLKFILVIDGQEQGIVRPSGSVDHGWLVEIPILPSELAEIDTLQLVPIIEYMAEFNGEAVPLDDQKTFDLPEDEGWDDTTEHTRLDAFTLEIM